MQIGWKKRIAALTSNIVNPFSVSFLMVILLSVTSASSTIDAVKWISISVVISILPVFAVIIYLVRNERLEGIFIKAREQRNKIYLLAGICAAVCCAVLYFLGAPGILVVSFVAGLSAIVIFMCINLWWKISVHTAFVAASVTVLIIMFGSPGAVAAVLLPPIAWSRIELRHHSPAQVAGGAFAASLVVMAVLYLFGMT